MSPFVSLHGLAVPFNEAILFDERFEYFRAGAFEQFLASSPSAYLNFGSHDAARIASSVELFASSFGLFFRASIGRDVWDDVRPYVVSNYSFCSVGGLTMATATPDLLSDGRRCVAIARAGIDHVTITSSPAYEGTGVWLGPRDRVGQLPLRLARLEHKWSEAKHQHDVLRAIKQRHQ